jgi:hypothetical protein
MKLDYPSRVGFSDVVIRVRICVDVDVVTSLKSKLFVVNADVAEP